MADIKKMELSDELLANAAGGFIGGNAAVGMMAPWVMESIRKGAEILNSGNAEDGEKNSAAPAEPPAHYHQNNQNNSGGQLNNITGNNNNGGGMVINARKSA